MVFSAYSAQSHSFLLKMVIRSCNIHLCDSKFSDNFRHLPRNRARRRPSNGPRPANLNPRISLLRPDKALVPGWIATILRSRKLCSQDIFCSFTRANMRPQRTKAIGTAPNCNTGSSWETDHGVSPGTRRSPEFYLPNYENRHPTRRPILLPRAACSRVPSTNGP